MLRVQKVLACFLLLALAGGDEVGAAPGSRERRESKSQNDNFASFQQQNQQLQIQSSQPRFQQEQPRSFQATPTQNSAAFPDVINAQQQQQQQQFKQGQNSPHRNQPFQTQFSRQQQPQQGFQTAPRPSQFGGAQQAPSLPLTAGPGSGRSLFDQIVNKINSGHRQNSQRKQGTAQTQPQPSNPFRDPTITQSQGRIPQNPNFPRVNPSIPDPPIQVVNRQNASPQRLQPQGIPQTNQQTSRNLGLALFGNGNRNRFGQTTQRPAQPFFPTEAVPNRNFLEVQRQQENEKLRLKELEGKRQQAIEEQRLKTIEEQRLNAIEEQRLKAIEEQRLQTLEQEQIREAEEQRLKQIEAQKQKEIEEQRLAEAEAGRLKAIEGKRLKEIEEQKIEE